MKKPSMELIMVLCSSLLRVKRPIIEYTDTLIKANDTPMVANNTLALPKLLPVYIYRQAPNTSASPSNMLFL